MHSSEFNQAVEKLKKYTSWIIVCHENPDGDTIGSAAALYSFGKRTGKRVRIFSKDAVPFAYKFLPYTDAIEVCADVDVECAVGALLIAVDISNEQRTVNNFVLLNNTADDSLSFDHHGDNTRFAGTNCIDDSASATAEIITDVIISSGLGISREEAILLYTALVTDNGNFCYNMTSPASHRCAEKLLEAGAVPNEINDRLIENMSVSAVRIWGVAMSRMKVTGECAVMWLSESEIASSCRDRNDLNGLVNVPLRIVGIKLSILITGAPNGVKFSVRSRAPFNAREFAAVFGGGGHVNAAGGFMATNLRNAILLIETEAERYAKKRNIAAE